MEIPGADPKAPVYEGHYVIGLKPYSQDHQEHIEEILTRWTADNASYPNETKKTCSLTWTIHERIRFQQWEELEGNQEACTRYTFPPFLAPPNPVPTPEESSPFKSKSRSGKSRSQSNSPQKASQPTPSLCPAHKILSRLRHDPGFDIDEYYIGYKDRFTTEMKEIPAREWVKETTHEAFVPESRIWYFKRRHGRVDIMWDREEKIDRISGSGVLVNEEV